MVGSCTARRWPGGSQHPGHDRPAGTARRAVVAAECAQGLFGRQRGLAGWPCLAPRRCQRVRSGGRSRCRSAGTGGCGARPARNRRNSPRCGTGREQDAGNHPSDHGLGVSAPMKETAMASMDCCQPRPAATRRELLIGTGALFAWAFAPRIARAEGRDPRFLAIVLRGALDGLAAVAPVGDPDWIKLRGDNALRLDGKTAALPLDGFFALNPAMPNVHRMYQAGEATIVHAVASPYRDRSHFDGQDVLESGLPRPGRAAESGWLNRALTRLEPGDGVRVSANGQRTFAVGPVTPLVVRGQAPVLSWVPPRLPPVSDDTTSRLLDLYRHTDPTLARVLEERISLAALAPDAPSDRKPGEMAPVVQIGNISQVR